MNQNQNNVSTMTVYSRARAIEDGKLIDVTAHAAREGFTVPVAFTRSAYFKAVIDAVEWMRYAEDVPEGMQLAGVLDMIHFYVVQAPPAVRLTVSFDIANEKVTFEVICGPDDDGNPCVTILLASGSPAASTEWCDRCRRAREVNDRGCAEAADADSVFSVWLSEGEEAITP